MLAKFDEINKISENRKRRSIPYDEYFGEMDLSEDEKEERKEFAQILEIILLFVFLSIIETNEYKEAQQIIYEKYINAAKEFLGLNSVPSYIDDYARQLANETVRVINENPDNEYYLSKDRAMFVAENEANVIGNYRQQAKAIKQGFTKKKWVTMRDVKVRHTHEEVDGETIDIFSPFTVGKSKMMFPKDYSLDADAKEIVNCRCVLEYLK